MSLPRVNMLLLFLALGLGGLVWWDLKQSEPGVAPILSDWKPGEVVAIRVRQPAHEGLHLERKSGAVSSWWMVSPQQGEVRDDLVERLLEILVAPYRARFDVQDLTREQRRQMGLGDAASQGVLTLVGQDGIKTLQMRFGNLETQTYHRYVQMGEQVYLVFDRFTYLLGMPTGEWLHDEGNTE